MSYGVPPVPVVPVVGDTKTPVATLLMMICPVLSRAIVMVTLEVVMRVTPLRPSWRITVPCPAEPPCVSGAFELTTKTQIEKVGIFVPAGNPVILLVETVKVQDPKATVPVAV